MAVRGDVRLEILLHVLGMVQPVRPNLPLALRYAMSGTLCGG